METNKSLPKQSEIKVKNLFEAPLMLYLEPWGEEHLLGRGESLIVEAFSEFLGGFELEFDGKSLFLYGWAGSVCQVKSDLSDLRNPMAPIASESQ